MVWLELTDGRLVNLDKVVYIECGTVSVKGKEKYTTIDFVFFENEVDRYYVRERIDVDYKIAKEVVRQIALFSTKNVPLVRMVDLVEIAKRCISSKKREVEVK